MPDSVVLHPAARSFRKSSPLTSELVAPEWRIAANELASDELVIIDGSLSHRQMLLDGLRPRVGSIVLDTSCDGITQITQALANYRNLKALHILAHGQPGQIVLGNEVLNAATLGRYTLQLQAWQNALAANADLLIYGCEVAAGAEATDFLRQIQQLTHANIAAATTLTGAPALGGNANLELHLGTIQTATLSLTDYPAVLAPTTGTTGFDANGPDSPLGGSPATLTVAGYTLTMITNSQAAITDVANAVNFISSTSTWQEARIASDDGSEFQLDNFNFNALTSSFSGDTFTITGYRDNAVVAGATSTRTVDAGTGIGVTYLVDVASDTDFDNIDEIRITVSGSQGGTFRLDDITISTAVSDATPPTLTSFALQTPGTSPTNADILVFRASFDEDVQNVDTADFAVGGGTSATVTNVTQINASTYDITVSGGDLASFNGTVGLNLSGSLNIQDLAGNALPIIEPSTDQTYTLDNAAPAAPSIPDLDAGSDTGSSNTDNITSDTTPTITGTAEANSTVNLTSSVDGAIGSTTADGAGNWSITASVLTAGAHNITATATDAAGNVSGASSALSITIDTAAPTALGTPDLDAGSDTGSSNTDNITSDTTPTFTGTAEANSTVNLTSSVDGAIGSTTADGSGNWSITASALTAGAHNITATATDAAGNVSGASTALPITIDTTAPGVSAVTPSPTTIQDSTVGSGTFTLTVDFDEAMNMAVSPTIAFPTGGEDPSSTITFASGSWSDADTYVATYNIVDANETINNIDVQVNGGQDLAGNSHTSSTQANEFSIDTASAIAFSSATFASAENVGTSNAVTLTRMGDTSGTASVQVSISGGTATGGGTDYTSSSFPLTVNFAAGETSKTVDIPINDDGLNEAAETITLSLGSPSNATLGAQNTTTLTITDNDALPSLAIDDVMVNEGAGTASFTVSLTPASGQTVTVNYATSDGTAVAGTDYTATGTQTLTFNPGDTSKTVTINVTDDALDEASETFNVTLSGATNATIADTTGVGTITDNDAPPSLSIDDVTVDEGAGTASFTVSLNTASGQAVSVDYATADGTATAGSDYTANAGTLNFAAGETSKTVTVNITDDATFDGIETFTVDLSNAVNAAIADNQGIGTIIDNDVDHALAVSSTSVTEGNAGVQTITFTINRTGSTSLASTIDYAFSGTAVLNTDYNNIGGSSGVSATSGTVSFAAGEASKTITVDVIGDTLDENDNTLTVTLSNASVGTISTTAQSLTINDDDNAPTIAIDDVTVSEGAGTASFTISLSAASGKAISVDYATADGTATAGSDYTTNNGTLNFAAGETSKTVTVTLTNDATNEATETFVVDLSNPTNATIADTQGQATINDDDGAPTLSISDPTVNENAGTATFTVSLSAASGQAISVDYATADGTATAGSDYTTNNGTLNFAAGVTSQDITVTILNDLLNEASETFDVNLTNPTNATIADATGQGTINDDDAPPTLSITDATVNENAGTASFTVSLSAASGQAVSVNYATADGTATAGSDYTSNTGTLNFAAGETSKTVTVNITDDALNEVAETFDVNLSAPTNATIADGTGQGTINDNDSAPTISVNDVSVAEGNAGTTAATFTISLSGASGQTITVNYASADNTATIADSDYNAATGTLTFNPGETTKTVDVLVVGDAAQEGDETFFLNLSAPTNATIADNQGLGTLQGDDVPTNVTGGSGVDNLVGTSGPDNLIGYAGPDTLTGGAGDDQFVMTDFDDRQDTITDFTPGDDRINMVQLFDEYNITAATYTDAATQGYLSIISDGAGGSIVRFDRNGTVVPSFLDSIAPENFIRVQGIAPATLGSDANFVLQ
ncbi:MAG: Calx-beta domain-containing protein [Cyanobacteria bacterium P01_G01_bin.54]